MQLLAVKARRVAREAPLQQWRGLLGTRTEPASATLLLLDAHHEDDEEAREDLGDRVEEPRVRHVRVEDLDRRHRDEQQHAAVEEEQRYAQPQPRDARRDARSQRRELNLEQHLAQLERAAREHDRQQEEEERHHAVVQLEHEAVGLVRGEERLEHEQRELDQVDPDVRNKKDLARAQLLLARARVLGDDRLVGGEARERLLGALCLVQHILPEAQQQRERREVEQRGELAEGRDAHDVDVDVGRQDRHVDDHVLVAVGRLRAQHPLERVRVAKQEPGDAREVGEAQERRKPAHALDRNEVRRVAVLAQAPALDAHGHGVRQRRRVTIHGAGGRRPRVEAVAVAEQADLIPPERHHCFFLSYALRFLE